MSQEEIKLDKQIAAARRRKAKGELDQLIRKRMDAQIAVEIDLAQGFKRCPKNSIDPSEIQSLEQQKALQDFTKFSFFEVGVMEALFCAFDTNVTVANPKDYSADKKIQQFFKNLRQIGAESVEGYALFAGFKDIKDLFVIKVPRDPNNDNLFHEYFIGVACLNKLRRIVPNYSYVFGAFKCLPPSIAADKEVRQWCGKGNNGVNYVIFEKIEGPSMKKVADQIGQGEVTFSIYFSYLVQTFLALRVAWASCNFTHYDLHDENIIIRKIPGHKELYVPYPVNPGDNDGEILYLRTDGIPSFIDYGRCHIRLDIETGVRSFGFFGFESMGLYPDKARPLHDLYKIIGFSMFSVAGHQTAAADRFLETAWGLLEMWKFIKDKPNNADEVRVVLSNEREGFFEIGKDILPMEGDEDPIMTILDKMKDFYPNEWDEVVVSLNKVPNDGNILNCQNLTCSTAAEVKRRLT